MATKMSDIKQLILSGAIGKKTNIEKKQTHVNSDGLYYIPYEIATTMSNKGNNIRILLPQ